MAKCGKICFKTRVATLRAMRAVPPRKSGQAPVRVYRCGRCKAYHFTSKPRR